MKKDKNFFLERLPCGISRMKRNNSVEHLREPKLNRRNDEFSEANVANPIRYNEMLPGPEIKSGTAEMVLEFPDDEDLFSLEMAAISKPQLFLMSLLYPYIKKFFFYKALFYIGTKNSPAL